MQNRLTLSYFLIVVSTKNKTELPLDTLKVKNIDEFYTKVKNKKLNSFKFRG